MARKKIFFISITCLLFNLVSMQSFAEDNHENKTGEIKLTPQSMQQNGIQTEVVKPQNINQQLEVVGKVTPNRDAMAFIYPRYAGIVKVLKKNLGENVQADEVLATVESNESLQSYDLRSPISGTIIKKNAIQGELVKEDKPIYEIANLNTVWVDLSIYCKDVSCVQVGQPVLITTNEGKLQAEAKIAYVAPIGIEDNQTMMARVVLSNPTRQWIPGMYVDATITIAQKQAPIAVNRGAIQKIAGQSIVFVRQGEIFKAVPVQLGMAGKDFIEILSGLNPGQSYVSKNSFILKAELGKNEIEDAD